MASAEEIKLLLDVKGGEAMQDLADNLAYTKKSLEQLRSAYDSGQLTTAQYLAQGTKLLRTQAELEDQIEGVTQAELELAKAQQRATMTEEEYLASVINTDAALQKKTATADKSAKSQANLRQSIQAGSYAFQDFTATSGDLGAKLNSISNNLPQLLVGLGGLGQVISIGATVAIALYRNWDQVTRLFETKNPFPKAGKTVKEMKDEVEHAKDEMKKLETNTSLTKDELAKYADLRKTIADTEAKITAEETKQANLKKFKEIKGTEAEERAKWIKEGLADLGGDKEDLATAVAKDSHERAIRQEERAYYHAWDMTGETDGEDRKAWIQHMQTSKREIARLKSPEGIEEYKNAGIETVTKAMNEGDLGSYNQLQTAAQSRPEYFTKEQLNYIRDASPETKKRVEEEERKEQAAEDIRKTRDEARQITRDAEKKRKAKEADKIRDSVDVLGKGGDFTKSTSELIDKIEDSGGTMEVAGKKRETKTAEQQYDVLKDMIQKMVEDHLKAQGIDPTGQEKLLVQLAGQLAGQAQTKNKQDAAAGLRTKDKATKIRNAMAKHQVQPQIDREDAEIKGGGYVEYAANLLAQMRAAGGAVDSAGRFHKMDDAAQRSLLAKHMADLVKSRNPGIRNQQATDMGNVISGRADQQVEQRMLGMGGTMLNNQQRLLSVSTQMASAFAQVTGRAISQGQAIAGLQRELDNVMRQARALSRPALKK